MTNKFLKNFFSAFCKKTLCAILFCIFLCNFCTFALDENGTVEKNVTEADVAEATDSVQDADASTGKDADASTAQSTSAKTSSAQTSTSQTSTAQTNAVQSASAKTEAGVPKPYTKDEFPSWVHSLRRGEIISIGSLPFTLFATGTAYSLYNYFKHDMDSLYRPNPFAKNFSSAPLSDKEKGIIFLTASGLSLGIGIADYIIEKVLTNAQSKNEENSNVQNVLPEGVTITPVFKTSSNEEELEQKKE